MGLFRKLTLSVVILSIFLGYVIHHPVPAPIPDPMEFQIIVDVLAASEAAAGVLEWFGVNRWWFYPGNLPIAIPYFQPEDVDINYTSFSGVESVIIIPKAFKEREEAAPAIVFYHGGGWVFGNLYSYLPLLTQAAQETGLLVFSPEYRKAPQHPFPIPFEDCLNSTLAFISRAKEFNVNPDKIVLAGDSAGGNLAMAITLQLIKMKKKNVDVHTPAMMTLIYPILQMGNFRLPSYQQNQKFMFSKKIVPKLWLSYIGLNDRLDLAGIVAENGHINIENSSLVQKFNGVSGDAVPEKYKARGYNSTLNPLTKEQKSRLDENVSSHMVNNLLDLRIAPLMASDEELSNLPQTHIMVCEYDLLRDDGVILYERLKRLSKPVTFQHLPNSLHATASVGALFTETYYGEQNKIIFDKIRNYMN